MLKSIEGIYRNGGVKLSELPEDAENTRIIVTFLPNVKPQELSAYGIDKAQAAGLRARLHTFEEDWNRSDMEAYDILSRP